VTAVGFAHAIGINTPVTLSLPENPELKIPTPNIITVLGLKVTANCAIMLDSITSQTFNALEFSEL